MILIPATSAEEWKNLLEDGEKQWKTGYSAKTLAHCWQEASGFPKSVAKVFKESGIAALREIKMLLAIPEHKVSLKGGSRPSVNDIWVLARGTDGLVSIAVEGKVREPFGPTIGEWLKVETSGKKKRLEYLCNELGLSPDLPDSIRYQLIHRSVSAIIEAKRFCANHAMMLIHSFSHEDEWFDDYKEFVSLFGKFSQAKPNQVILANKIEGVSFYCSWVHGEKDYLEK